MGTRVGNTSKMGMEIMGKKKKKQKTNIVKPVKEERPVKYHHTLDGKLESVDIGVMDSLESDKHGIYAEAKLDMTKRYVQSIKRLIDEKVLSWSSGSLPHLVEVDKDGQITEWPIVQASLTPTPATPKLKSKKTGT